jgi:FtsH-binding integral membrane protein
MSVNLELTTAASVSAIIIARWYYGRSGYLGIVFLYLLFAIAASSLVTKYIKKGSLPGLKHDDNAITLKLLGAFVISLALLFIVMVGMGGIVTHLAFVAFIYMMMYMIQPMLARFSDEAIRRSMQYVVVVMTLMTALALAYPEAFQSRHYMWLVMFLGLFIIARLVLIIFSAETYFRHETLFLQLGVVLFTLFVAYDVSILQKKHLTYGSRAVINYPADVMGLFLDALNLFVKILRLDSS